MKRQKEGRKTTCWNKVRISELCLCGLVMSVKVIILSAYMSQKSSSIALNYAYLHVVYSVHVANIKFSHVDDSL